MAKQDAFRARAQRHNDRRWLLPLSLALVAAFCLAVGINALWHHCRDSEPRLYRAPAGLVIIALGLLQLRIAQRVRQRLDQGKGLLLNWQPAFVRHLFLGLVVSYVVGLLLGPNPDVQYFFRASLVFWYTVSLLPLVIETASLGRWTRFASGGVTRRAGQLFLAAGLAFVFVEGSLRVVDLATNNQIHLGFAARALKLSPGSEFHGQRVNALGYADDEFDPIPRPGVFRIAVLGDDMTLSGTGGSNCLAQVERLIPGVEIYNFGLPSAGPRDYAAQLAHEVAAYHPDLVLTFFSIGDDVTQQSPLPGAFDWRGLRICQLGTSSLTTSLSASVFHGDPICPRDYEAYLGTCANKFAVCRTPINGPMQQHWEETLSYLDDLVGRCHAINAAMALVLVPGEFQVSPILYETLRRRLGYPPEQVDLELPQRRLVRYADQRHLPTLDLLPHFRAAETSPYARHAEEWNDRGNQIAAQVLSGWLRTRYGSQMAATAQQSAGR